MKDTITLPRAIAQQALHVATAAGYPVALIAYLRKALDKPEPPEQPDWLHLKRYGYAPGNYMNFCKRCGVVHAGLDKRATCCKPCAEVRHAFEQQPDHSVDANKMVQHIPTEESDAEFQRQVEDTMCKHLVIKPPQPEPPASD
jgi:hypothetical protein